LEGRKGESEMKRAVICLALLMAFGLSGCGKKSAETGWPGHEGFYSTVVKYSGENESDAKYLEIARKSEALLPLLEEKAGAFVMEAYNYQAMDEKGTPLYTMNGLQYPVEIDPNGMCIRVSRNYFKHNPIETADGQDVTEQFVYDDLTLNVLVPEKYRDMEEDIIAAYRDRFYFEKVEAENAYNRDAGLSARLDISEEDLKINIIYVKDGQKYLSFRRDCARQTGCQVEDPVVQIYTANIHCNYAHSFMTQWVYFPSDAGDAEKAYQEVFPIIQTCGAEKSVQKVVSLVKG